jgi:hypothetical protein
MVFCAPAPSNVADTLSIDELALFAPSPNVATNGSLALAGVEAGSDRLPADSHGAASAAGASPGAVVAGVRAFAVVRSETDSDTSDVTGVGTAARDGAGAVASSAATFCAAIAVAAGGSAGAAEGA